MGITVRRMACDHPDFGPFKGQLDDKVGGEHLEKVKFELNRLAHEEHCRTCDVYLEGSREGSVLPKPVIGSSTWTVSCSDQPEDSQSNPAAPDPKGGKGEKGTRSKKKEKTRMPSGFSAHMQLNPVVVDSK